MFRRWRCGCYAALLFLPSFSGQMIESERVNEYNKRKYRWPPHPSEYIPQTDGWRRLYDRRFRQIDALDDTQNPYDGYMNMIHAALQCPNFTEFGWGLTQVPKPLVHRLNQSLHEGLHDAPYEYVGEEEGMAKFVFSQDNDAVHDVLQPVLEAWSGVELVKTQAYGLRVYLNESRLFMHIDQVDTHIISAILHVDHDRHSEPWPLVIEDLDGNTNEVYLESGEMLMYESSKCVHGRPKRFRGSFYSSLFLHYAPVGWSVEERRENHFRVPPTWRESVVRGDAEPLVTLETSLKEPQCPHDWCGLKNTVAVRGPVSYAQVLSGSGTRTLDIPSERELLHGQKAEEL